MKSIAYYDRYFMDVSADSIKRTDSLNRKRMFAMAPKDTVMNGTKIIARATITYSPITQNFTRELNNGAYKFYKITNNPYLLSVATEWVRKGLEFFETPEALDTYAKLLYKQGHKEEAIQMETKAIAVRKARGFPVKDYEAVIDNMKKGIAVKE